MIKLPLAAALLAVAVAAPAAAQDKASFTHEGVTYSYTQEKVGDSTILAGTATSGDSFRYVVRNGRVVGKNNGVSVKFNVEDATAVKGMVTLVASR